MKQLKKVREEEEDHQVAIEEVKINTKVLTNSRGISKDQKMKKSGMLVKMERELSESDTEERKNESRIQELGGGTTDTKHPNSALDPTR